LSTFKGVFVGLGLSSPFWILMAVAYLLLAGCTQTATSRIMSAQSAVSGASSISSQLNQMWRMVNPPPQPGYPAYPQSYPGRPY
jgi:hypothetical protein